MRRSTAIITVALLLAPIVALGTASAQSGSQLALYIDRPAASPGEGFHVTARLVDGYGNAIAGRSVGLAWNGYAIVRYTTTDATGGADFGWWQSTYDRYPATTRGAASFAGDGSYSGSAGSAEVVIGQATASQPPPSYVAPPPPPEPKATQLTVSSDPRQAAPRQDFRVTARLADAGGNGVHGKTLSLSWWQGSIARYATTDPNGLADFGLWYNENAGTTSRATVEFSGDSNFRSASSYAEVTIGYVQKLDGYHSFANAAIADMAMQYLGGDGDKPCIDAYYAPSPPQFAGQCKQFVNCVIRLATGIQLPSGYYAGFASNARQVPLDQAQRGDVIQLTDPLDPDRNSHRKVLHTAIVTAREGGGIRVVDSNSGGWDAARGDGDHIVREHAWDPVQAARDRGLDIQVWRFGRAA